MTNWTPNAKQVLEEYLAKNRSRLATVGGDPDEVVADLRRHVEEELSEQNLTSVTEQDVRRVLLRLGHVTEESSVQPERVPPPSHYPGMSGLGSFALFLFGILLPAGTLIFELFTGGCADIFWDPIPTWLHVALIAAVPIGNLLAWLRVRGNDALPTRLVWWANGIAFGVALFYAILFLPTVPIAVIGILALGLGFLPLAPLLSFICSWRFRSHLRQQISAREERRPRGWAWAVFAPVLLLLLVAAPGTLTRYWILEASSDDEKDSISAIRNLRLFGSDEMMLRACYGWRRGELNFRPFHVDDAEAARKIYYRVTGKPFNSVPPPLGKLQKSGRNVWDEFEWDEGLGGETVAGQVRGLSMFGSRMDAIAKPEEGWSYVEWIMEFRNDHPTSEREARAQIQLPPGAVVSRLTLWVNGEEREAAFAGRSQVREAYQKVAVQQRRDPVLVTTSGPDRVLMQCFPVPRNGGTMKIRIGMTVPHVLTDPERLAFRLPCIVERNFKLSNSFQHSVWLNSSHPPIGGFGALGQQSIQSGSSAVHGEITDAALGSPKGVLWYSRSLLKPLIVAEDPRSELGNRVKQTIKQTRVPAPERVAIVLDGSAAMNSHLSEITAALEKVPAGLDVQIFLAQDGLQIVDLKKTRLDYLECVGGQDNIPALLAAWDWASAKQNSKVLWMHAAQPIVLSSVESLKQRLQWSAGPGATEIIDVPVEVGPNRIAEALSTPSALKAVMRFGSVKEDLTRLFTRWSGEHVAEQILWDTENSRTGSTPDGSFHIVRLWAYNQIHDLVTGRNTEAAVKLAGTYQLVTPVSGAVVLETLQQFTDAGLTPVDAMSVPAVPEPTTWALLLIGVVVLLFSRSVRKRALKTNASNPIEHTLKA